MTFDAPCTRFVLNSICALEHGLLNITDRRCEPIEVLSTEWVKEVSLTYPKQKNTINCVQNLDYQSYPNKTMTMQFFSAEEYRYNLTLGKSYWRTSQLYEPDKK